MNAESNVSPKACVGKLRVVEPVALNAPASTDAQWLCQCTCGRVAWVSEAALHQRAQLDCGICAQRGPIEGLRLTVEGLDRGLTAQTRRRYVRCRCACSNQVSVYWSQLNRGSIRSCGCLKRERDSDGHRRAQLIGRVFGDLEVLAMDHADGRRTYWLCRCNRCGSSSVVAEYRLTGGSNVTCGCGERDNRERIHERVQPYLQRGTNISKIRTGKAPSSNKSGVRGVRWCETKQRWIASLILAGKSHTSTHKSFEEAVAARREMEATYFKPIVDAFEAERASRNP